MIPGDPAGLDAAATELLRAAAGFDGAATTIRGRERDARAVRTGQAALAASDHLEDLARRTTIGAAVGEEVAPVLRRFAAELDAAQRSYGAAQEQLRAAATSAGPGGLGPTALAAGPAAGAPAQMVTAAETLAAANAAAARDIRAVMAARLGEMQVALPVDGPPGVPPPPPPPGDEGAGPWGVREATSVEHAQHLAASTAAHVFELIGRENAARHMRHFLDNTGAPLSVDPALMTRDDPVFSRRADTQANKTVQPVVEDAVRSGRYYEPVPFRSEWEQYEFRPENQPDWYYAVGTLSYSSSGTIMVLPPPGPGQEPVVDIAHRLHVFDRYNWDTGKDTDVDGAVVPDEVLQELHRAGLAREYDIHGTGSLQSTSRPLSEVRLDDVSAEERDGTRTDRDRSRW